MRTARSRRRLFACRLKILRIAADGSHHDCPLAWIDNFAMRNFTNDACFDDTLPLADGLMEASYRVQLDALKTAMADWFTRKGYLRSGESLAIQAI
jgi:hypothetical protein